MFSQKKEVRFDLPPPTLASTSTPALPAVVAAPPAEWTATKIDRSSNSLLSWFSSISSLLLLQKLTLILLNLQQSPTQPPFRTPTPTRSPTAPTHSPPTPSPLPSLQHPTSSLQVQAIQTSTSDVQIPLPPTTRTEEDSETLPKLPNRRKTRRRRRTREEQESSNNSSTGIHGVSSSLRLVNRSSPTLQQTPTTDTLSSTTRRLLRIPPPLRKRLKLPRQLSSSSREGLDYLR
ncbi:hypothetical protein BDY24DRAFT_7761 [Mrakia frigida]|uniref:uncharacterized protein n=1 Tax=Mrakia frigida TaxID=29902 RepID=UPI003FCC0E53